MLIATQLPMKIANFNNLLNLHKIQALIFAFSPIPGIISINAILTILNVNYFYIYKLCCHSGNSFKLNEGFCFRREFTQYFMCDPFLEAKVTLGTGAGVRQRRRVWRGAVPAVWVSGTALLPVGSPPVGRVVTPRLSTAPSYSVPTRCRSWH